MTPCEGADTWKPAGSMIRELAEAQGDSRLYGCIADREAGHDNVCQAGYTLH